MSVSKDSMCLYVVSDRTWLHGRDISDVLKQSLEGGATFLQLREKDISKDEFVKEGKKIQALAKQYRVPFVINDDIEVALMVDADGAHIGQSDGSVQQARETLGPNKILGVSVQNVQQALDAQAEGADYVGVGSMFSTTTKLDADAVSISTLKDICSAVSIPVVAIGGIQASNISLLQGTGCHGVAVVSAILASDDITKATQDLKELAKKV